MLPSVPTLFLNDTRFPGSQMLGLSGFVSCELAEPMPPLRPCSTRTIDYRSENYTGRSETLAAFRKEEARALSADERELVDRSHHPVAQDLLEPRAGRPRQVKRERREKAKAQAHQRRRDIRGKVEPKGASASKADGGCRLKLDV